MSTVRSFLDGLDPRVRFAVLVAFGFALVLTLWLVVFHESAWASIRAATLTNLVLVGGRAMSVGTWPWREPRDDDGDPT